MSRITISDLRKGQHFTNTVKKTYFIDSVNKLTNEVAIKRKGVIHKISASQFVARVNKGIYKF